MLLGKANKCLGYDWVELSAGAAPYFLNHLSNRPAFVVGAVGCLCLDRIADR